MKNYEKPIVDVNPGLAEGVYTASGDATPACDSNYINGEFRAPNYYTDASYIERFGCNGCPAFRWNGCALKLETLWPSYDVDNGHRRPNWEKAGYKPYDKIDWNTVGNC